MAMVGSAQLLSEGAEAEGPVLADSILLHLAVWSRCTPASRSIFSSGSQFRAVPFSPDGKTVLTGSEDKTAAAVGDGYGQATRTTPGAQPTFRPWPSARMARPC